MDNGRYAARRHRFARSVPLAFVLALTLAAPTWASVASEQREGAQVLVKLHDGKLKETSLSSLQYEQLGEYLMGQALGSTSAHERMSSLMRQMMGSTAVSANSTDGWPTGALVASAVLATLLLAGVLGLTVPRLRSRSRAAAAAGRATR